MTIIPGPTPTGGKFAVLNATQIGANVVVPAVPGKKIRVLSYTAIAAEEVTMTWQSGGGTAKSGPMPYGPTGGASPAHAVEGHVETEVGESLVAYLSAAVPVTGHLKWIEV